MEFRQVLAKRRMVRNYTDEPVDQAALQRVAKAATRAPSAGFSQGQAVVVVTDPETRRQIAAAADEPAYVAQGFDPWISRAPALLVLCVSEDAYHRRYQMPDKVGVDGAEIEWPVPFWWVDVGASLMAVLLAAVDEGLAAGFLGVQAFTDLRRLIGVPDEYLIVGVVTIGHPAPDRRSSSLDLGRRAPSTVIHYDAWAP
jgi:nitroreductase